MSIKLLSLNIEGDNHLDKVISLFGLENPDLICLNEVFEADVAVLKHASGMEGLYFPAIQVLQENDFRLSPKGNIGTLVMSKTPFLSYRQDYYDGDPLEIPELTNQANNAANRFLVWVEVEKDGEFYRVVTTHFTITKGGQASDLQRANMNKVLAFLSKETDFVLCGDFNAPRGGEIFSMLAAKYTDQIPGEVRSTLDPKIHRSGNKPDFPEFVVDGLFTAGKYQVGDVRVVCGVSDHCALITQIKE